MLVSIFQEIRFDWYQSDSHVCISYMRKKLSEKDVRVEFDKQSVGICMSFSMLEKASLFLVTASGDELLKRFELAHEIVPEKSSHRVSPVKIELRLKKCTDIKWDSIELRSKEDSAG